MMNFKDNASLLLNLKEGNRKAFSFVIDSYHHELCVYANSLINNNIQAEDVVQNVLIRLWEKRHNLNKDFSLKSFLYKSVYNEFIDQYRKTQSVLKIEKIYIDTIDTIVEPNSKEDTDKLISLVNKTIQQLPPKCKQIFELSKTEGLSNVEISEFLNINIKTVEAQITKGYKTIRTSLKEKINSILFLLFRTQILN